MCNSRSGGDDADRTDFMSTDSTPARKTRRPRKFVTDEARAAEILEELREEHERVLASTRRRLELAYEASELGLTTTKIGSAIGASQTTVAAWVRAGRDRVPETD